jgi:trehalose-phosphatase
MNPDPIPNHWTEDLERLSERLLAPPRLLVACDFDGTLAPLAPSPESAALPAATSAVLRQLTASGVHLAILSGRALADVQDRVGVPVDCFAGNHGLEMAGHGLDGDRAPAGALQPRLATLADQLDRRLRHLPGVLIENKRLSLSVHYRRVAPDQWPEVTRAATEVAATDNAFRLQAGHRVAEILPALPWDKGEALKQIAGRLGIPRSAVMYLGDDTTDEHAFRAIPNGTSVSVGDARPSTAHWMARCPDDVRRLLAWVADLRR